MQDEPYPPRPLTERELGWVAGLYEGEGTAYCQVARRGPNGAKSTGVRVCICMTDRDVLERLDELFPMGRPLAERKRYPNCKRQYEWRISKRDQVATFLTLILPLLGARRTEQVQKVLAIATDPRGGLGSGHRNKTHCPHGHEYTPENTYRSVTKDGYHCRNCRACRRDQRRARLKPAC